MAGKRDRLSGNEAIAIALRQINPDVFPAFPITPSTEIPQYFASFVANGQVDTEFIPVESEHSSMSAAIGASAAGARSLTATSSCGLAYMWEELYIAASNRLPLALALVNRALSGHKWIRLMIMQVNWQLQVFMLNFITGAEVSIVHCQQQQMYWIKTIQQQSTHSCLMQ